MVALLYLKHAYNESYESVVVRWPQDVDFHFVCRQVYSEPWQSCDPAQISRFRRMLGEAGIEQLLKTTVESAVDMGAVKKTQFERVIVDTKVQEKAIVHPTDSWLPQVALEKIARLAKRARIRLKQTHERKGKTLRHQAGHYAHAKQFRQLRGVLNRQRTSLGGLLSEVHRKIGGLADHVRASLDAWVQRAERIHRQRSADENKLHALHAPEAGCISKVKARKLYEFGVKVSLVVTHQHGLVVGARRFPSNPYDGHTLASQIEQAINLLQDIDAKPVKAIVDLGHRGADKDLASVQVIHRGKAKSLTPQQKRWMHQRRAIGPVIGCATENRGMDRCWLKGTEGGQYMRCCARRGSTDAGSCGPSPRWAWRPYFGPSLRWRCGPVSCVRH